MRIKQKSIRRDDWRRIIRRAFACESFANPALSGEVALIRIDQVREPLYVTVEAQRYKIVDTGYRWLQIAPRGQHWWLTTMFDETGALIQHYFDITLQNHIRGGGESTFLDLFLDVVLLPDGQTVLLDQNELDEALREGEITPAQHALAGRTAQTLSRELPARCAELAAFCQAWRARLEARLT